MPNPLFVLLLILVGAPLAELYVLIEVGGVIGAVPTIALSVFTAILGAWLVRVQGLSVLLRAQAQMARKEMPAFELLEGVVLLVTGIALLLPGFITDAIGFALLLPPLRRALILGWLQRRGTLHPVDIEVQVHDREPGRIIDGSFRRED